MKELPNHSDGAMGESLPQKEKNRRKGTHGAILGRLRALLQRRRRLGRAQGDTAARTLRGLSAMGLCFLFGICRFPFSVYPLGIAFLCAATDSVGYCVLGFLLSGLMLPLPLWLYPAACALTLSVRVLTRLFVDLPSRLGETAGVRPFSEHLRGRVFAESLYLRMTSSCVSAFFVSLVAIVGGGFRYYDLFGALLAIAAAPVAVFLYAGFFASDGSVSGRLRKITEQSAPVALSVSVCFALRGGLFGVFFCPFAATLAILILCRKCGFFPAVIAAVGCGASIGGAYIPVLLAVAVVGYSLMDSLPTIAAAASAAAGTLVAYLIGKDTLASTLFLPLLCAAAVFYSALSPQKTAKENAKPDTVPPPQKSNAAYGKLTTAFSALSELAANRNAEAFALDYAAAAKLLFEEGERLAARQRHDTNAEKSLYERLCVLGFAPVRSEILGERGKKVILSLNAPAPDEKTERYLAEQMEKHLGIFLSAPNVCENGSHVTLTYEEKASFRAESDFSFCAAEGVCGDAVVSFRDKENAKFYALISDGMGAGKNAALVARTAASFLKKLLCAAAREQTALCMLNNFLRLGGSEEISTTADLLVIDEYTGEARFFKCGAAPGYVKRGASVYTLSAGTVPLGILRETDIKEMKFDLVDGDTVVLTSDGVGEGEECTWLVEHLKKAETVKGRELAKFITSSARERGSLDDLSALVVTLKKAL